MGIKCNNPLNGGKYFYVFFFFTALLYDFIPSYHSIFIVLSVLLFRVTRISRVYAFAAMFSVSYVLQSISFRTNKSNILHSFVLNFQVCKIKGTISFKFYHSPYFSRRITQHTRIERICQISIQLEYVLFS